MLAISVQILPISLSMFLHVLWPKVSVNFDSVSVSDVNQNIWFRSYTTSAIQENIEIQITNSLAPFCSCNNAAISQFFPFLFRFRRWGQTWHINDLKHSAGDMNSIAINFLNIPRQREPQYEKWVFWKIQKHPLDI